MYILPTFTDEIPARFLLQLNFTVQIYVVNFLVAYIIWYGTWDPISKSIIETFVKGVGDTPWWAINRQYGVSNLVYKGSYTDVNYSQGKVLNTPWNVVQTAFNNGGLPADRNAIYLVLSSR